MKGINIDDLKVGQWIAIIDVLEEEEDSPYGFMAPPSKHRRYPINGKPLKILCIDLPFICVTDGSKTYSLHSKYCSFKRLKPSYVRYMLATSERDRHESHNVCFVFDSDQQRKGKPTKDSIIRPGKIRKAGKEDSRGRCPQCGSRLRQRRVSIGTWAWVCPDCGFTGGNTADA